MFTFQNFFSKLRLHPPRERIKKRNSGSGSSSSQPVSISPPPGLPQPQSQESDQVQRRVRGKSAPSACKVAMINNLEECVMEIKDRTVNADQEESEDELQLLQDLRLQEWCKGDFSRESRKQSRRSSSRLVKQVMKCMSQFHSDFFSQ